MGSMYHTPPRAPGKGVNSNREVSVPAAQASEDSPSPRTMELDSSQQELQRHGLAGGQETVKALDIELGRVRQEFASLDNLVRSHIAPTLDTVSGAYVTDLSALRTKLQGLQQALQDQATTIDRQGRELELLKQQNKQLQQQLQHQQHHTASGTSYVVVHGPEEATPDQALQAVCLSGNCNKGAVVAVLPLGTGTRAAPGARAAAGAAAAAAAGAADGAAAGAAAGATAGAAAGTAGAAADGAAARRRTFLVKVAAPEVRERALRGKSKLRLEEALKGFYLEPRRTPEQQRAYKLLHDKARRLRQRQIRYRWQRDANGVEIGLQRQQPDGSWAAVVVKTAPPAAAGAAPAAAAAAAADAAPTPAPAPAAAGAAPAPAPAAAADERGRSKSRQEQPGMPRRSARSGASRPGGSKRGSRTPATSRGSPRRSRTPSRERHQQQQQQQQHDTRQDQDQVQQQQQQQQAGKGTKKKQKKEKAGGTAGGAGQLEGDSC